MWLVFSSCGTVDLITFRTTISWIWDPSSSFYACNTHRRNEPIFINVLIADGPHHYHPTCGHQGSSHLSLVHALRFLSRCKFSTLTTRQPMVEFYLLTFPRFPSRKKEHKSYFSKNRTHDFRTIRCAGYLLDHSDLNQNVSLLISYNIITFLVW